MEELTFYGLHGIWAALALVLVGGTGIVIWMRREHRDLKKTVYVHKEELRRELATNRRELDDKDTKLESRIQANEHQVNSAQSAHQRLEKSLGELKEDVRQNNTTLQAVKEQNSEILGRLMGLKEERRERG